jgi:hypothetical protein
LIAPAPERYRHSAIERLDKPIADSAGHIARPYRAVDTLAIMLRRGTITAAMREAGETFREKFQLAHLDALHAANLERTASGKAGGDLSFRVVAAREHIWRAVCACGGLASAGGSVLWHVLGLERTLKDWALEQGWAGRRCSQETASGMLVAALGVLEAHYSGDSFRQTNDSF